jgi:hypothetical protein
MTQLDRRRVLTSLAGGAAVAGVTHAISKGALSAPVSDAAGERAERHYSWYLAQQGGRAHGQHAIDFWSAPWAVVRYENYLPPQIARALIAYEDFPRPIDSTDKALEAFIEASKFYGRDWLDPATLDRFIVEPNIGSKDFQSILTSFVGEKDASMLDARYRDRLAGAGSRA